MFTRARLLTACAALALAPAAAACGGSSPKSHPTSDGPSSPSSSLVATRWWSNSATTAGSTIDPKHPEAVAAQLDASKTDYCGMLRQTAAAGRSILPNVTANDPALLISTKAFVAELEAVAPSSVAGSWEVLGPAVITIVESGGGSAAVKKIDAAAVQEAARTVAADAKRSCGVDLSSGVSG
jgi:hypothetical protein